MTIFKVFNTVYTDGKVPDAVNYLTGTFGRSNDTDTGLLAPLYFDNSKQLYLFSHHPRGKVWQVSTKLSTTPLTGPLPPDQVSFSIEVCVFTVLFVGILVVGKRKPHIHQERVA